MRLHRPATRRVAPPLALYFHAGRFLSSNADECETVARTLAARLEVAVLSPAYSLATAEPFPGATEDAYAALIWAQTNAAQGGWNARRMAVIGDEAGGNLAAAVAVMARDRDGPALTAQVLIAPMLDPSLSSCSMRAAGEMSARCDEAYRRYLPQLADRLHPYAAPPLCTRLDGLPPALILSARDDALRDEAEGYGAKLIAAGVKVQVTRLGTRGWSEAAWREIAGFLDPLLKSPRRRGNPVS
jgi:acetyl esterase